MINTKVILKYNTILLFICLLVVAFFSIGPVIEERYIFKVYDVVFDLGDDKYNSITVIENEPIIKPENPEREGYTFIGWYRNDEEYNFDLLVKEDMIIKAYWEKEKTKYKITFDSRGGTIYQGMEVEEGSVISEVIPIKNGFTFVEWRVDGIKYDFNTPILKDTNFVAVWRKN